MAPAGARTRIFWDCGGREGPIRSEIWLERTYSTLLLQAASSGNPGFSQTSKKSNPRSQPKTHGFATKTDSFLMKSFITVLLQDGLPS